MRHSCEAYGLNPTSLLLLLAAWVALVPSRETAGSSLGTLEFEHLSIGDGFSGYTITAVVRDHLGFLWVGTQRGLCRYDGTRVRVFGRTQGHLIDDDITALAEDPMETGVIWIGTRAGGLSRFDSTNENFTSYGANLGGVGSTSINTLSFDRRGVLWVGTSNAGLCRFDPGERYCSRPAASGNFPGKSVFAILEPQSRPGELWIGADIGLFVLDPLKSEFRRLPGPPTKRTLNNESVTAIAEAGGSIWYGTGSGLLRRIDPAGLALQDSEIIGERISFLAPSKRINSILWVGTRGKGLYSFDLETWDLHQFRHDPDVTTSLSRDDVRALAEDDAGLLWVGTVVGLNKASLIGRRFKPRLIAGQSSLDTQGTSVLALYATPSDESVLWVSVLRRGVFRYSRATDRLVRVDVTPKPLDLIFSFLEDNEGRFWMAGGYPYLFRLNRENGTTEAFRISEREDFLVHQIFESRSRPGILWLATRDDGLLGFDQLTKKVVARFSVDSPLPKRLTSNYVWSLSESPNNVGIVSLATRWGGLNQVDLKSGSVTYPQASAGPDCSVSKDIISIASTSDGIVWMGTYGSGLLQFDLVKGTCRNYAPPDGLAYSDVAMILVDNQERLWLSTSNGLTLLDRQTRALSTFSVEDGLQSNVFHYNVGFRASNGELFFGGTNGFNVIRPDTVSINRSVPRVVLTSFLVQGKPHPLPRGSSHDWISLDYRQNDLAFEFAALDLWQPHKNRFKVILEGAEDNWRPISGKPEIRYPALAPGRFTFRVVGSNNDGYWNLKGADVRIEIQPPYWQRWWFRISSGLFVLAIIVGGYQYRIHQLLQIERTRQGIADDLHDDLGSKFSSIALQLDVDARKAELPDESRRRLRELSQLARDAVDDLRDTVWIIDSANDDLMDLVVRMEQLSAQVFVGRELKFERSSAVPDCVVAMPWRRHVFLTFKEAIHNAVIHSEAKQFEVLVACDIRSITWSVSDNGVGFNIGGTHSGRGLQSMRRRANLLKGEMEVRSSPGMGTSVRFSAPIP